MLPLEEECINVVEDGLTLEREIVRYSSVSRSPTLYRNEKVEQHIRKKTRKPNALRFWIKDGVITLYELTLISFLQDLSKVFFSDYPKGESITKRKRFKISVYLMTFSLLLLFDS